MIIKIEKPSAVRVEKVSLVGNGMVILTGPSSCGKGEVAAALCRVMSIENEAHLSMGDILRSAAQQAKHNTEYANLLAQKYNIRKDTTIYDSVDINEDLSKKINEHASGLKDFFKNPNILSTLTQLEWLEFCTFTGLLVPNRWTQDFITAHIESSPRLRNKPFILDGYPRTVKAAQHLLSFLKTMDIPIIKVLHLSISKQEMLSRAKQRGRADDDERSLMQRFQFYIDSVQPSVDYMKYALGPATIALIDAHQPHYDIVDGEKKFNLALSIANVVADSLRGLGVPRIVVRDLLDNF